MKQKDNSGKDWGKEAKAFARQAYGRGKAESIRRERRIAELEKAADWDD